MRPIVHLVAGTIQLSTLAVSKHSIPCAKRITVIQFTRIPRRAATKATTAASTPLRLSYPHLMGTTRRTYPQHMRRDNATSKFNFSYANDDSLIDVRTPQVYETRYAGGQHAFFVRRQWRCWKRGSMLH